jgi:hypothetical protein
MAEIVCEFVLEAFDAFGVKVNYAWSVHGAEDLCCGTGHLGVRLDVVFVCDVVGSGLVANQFCFWWVQEVEMRKL